MLLADGLGDPDHRRIAVLPSDVREDLAKMAVVCLAELVLDHDDAPFDVAGEDVDIEVAYRNLGALKLKIPEEQRLTQHREVFGIGKPRCEVIRLVRPDLTQRDRFKPAKY